MISITTTNRGSSRRIDDAEPVAFGVGEDDVVGIGRPLVPMDFGRPERDQALDFGRLVVRVQVEMDPWRDLQRRMMPIERHVRPDTVLGRSSTKSSLASARGR